LCGDYDRYEWAKSTTIRGIPAYDFDDEAIPYGVALWATLVERKLPKGNAGS
jgi:hypothetical protein